MSKELKEIVRLRRYMAKYPKLVQQILADQMQDVRDAASAKETGVQGILDRSTAPAMTVQEVDAPNLEPLPTRYKDAVPLSDPNVGGIAVSPWRRDRGW